MEQAVQCLVPVDFDSRAFGFPYYRVSQFDERQIRLELIALAGAEPLAADCKVPADDVDTSHALMRLGFRKVCMQVTLRHDLAALPEFQDSGVRIEDRLGVDEETTWEHARNFTRDRFSLDPLLPAAGRHRLYYQWLRNSFGGAKQVAHIGRNVCTFSAGADGVIIDLVSILEPRRGNGSRLIAAVLEHARQRGASCVRVKTECENVPAWRLYQQKGFVTEAYTSVFHWVYVP